ncbi:hypothetical protein TSUD_50540 [Trifolium subterraneum]|uniref:DYW domain-containing protein n=1 Tax=Trifolium subterraneum TaxID=3900 RepID=A0A2Z6LWW8_TRISU|nr:hypothetical protein TSUD_50540 [Trifolium subterraneum]
MGKKVHAMTVVSGFESDPFVSNTLVVMYAKCGQFGDSKNLFGMIVDPNVVSWNALFSCHVQSDFLAEAVDLFKQMVASEVRPNEFSLSIILNACAGLRDGGLGTTIHGLLMKLGYGLDQFSTNALVDMYAKAGMIEDAVAIFREIIRPDTVSWNAVIAGCVLHEYHDLALILLNEMKKSGTCCPNVFTLSSALKACAAMGFKALGTQIHSCLVKIDTHSDLFVAVGLIDLYSKCEMMDDARRAYDLIPTKEGTIAGNALISGYSQCGDNEQAISLFLEMHLENIDFNQTTLSTVLKSVASLQAIKCSHIDEASKIFEERTWEDLVAYTSMITAYSQYGDGEEALKLYLQMQAADIKPDPFEPAISWIEVKDKIHTFIVGDRNHSRSDEIYAKLDELNELLSKAGYSPIIETDIHNVEQSEKEKLLYHHSEKLAVAFGLIATPPGAPIRVMKNLRVCVDCHTFLKFVAKIVSRQIVVRDINRFHHFKDGSCSCGDFW